jgi:ComF family protein
MSTLFGTPTLRALNFSAPLDALLAQDCMLCAGESGNRLVCAACSESLPRMAFACVRCAVELPQGGTCGQCQRRAPSFDAAFAAFEYRFPLDRVVQRFKYASDLAAGKWLARQLADRVAGTQRPDLLVAPPLAASRLRERGFNQSVVLAKFVANALGVPHAPGALAKARDTSPQPGLGRRARAANLRGAFRCNARFAGEHVAIVDDVMTTGATADALSRVLKAAGAGRVTVWAVARTLGSPRTPSPVHAPGPGRGA